MERPSLEDYRRVLREQGIEPSDEELERLREQTQGLAGFIAELYLEELGKRSEEGES